MTLVQTQNQGTSFVTVRGISQARNSEPSVAVLIDGVAMANPSQFNQELIDIESIQVLKGPQGALYGRNAIGGAIIITSKQPTDEFEGRISAGYDSGPGYRVGATVSGPISETVKYRATVSYLDTDGYIDNPFLDEEADPYEDLSARGLLVWEPNDGFRADLRAYISDVSTQALYFNITESVNDTSLPVRVNNRGVNDRELSGASLKLDWSSSFGTITSVTAYDKLEEILTGDQFNFLPIPESVLFQFFGRSGAAPVPRRRRGEPGAALHVARRPIACAGSSARTRSRPIASSRPATSSTSATASCPKCAARRCRSSTSPTNCFPPPAGSSASSRTRRTTSRGRCSAI